MLLEHRVDQPDADAMLADRSRQEGQSSINATGHVARLQTHSMFDASEMLKRPGPLETWLQHNCSTPGVTGLEKALQDCRCGSKRWSEYLVRAPNPNCPAYVEEINAAQNMGRGLPWLRQMLARGAALYANAGWNQAYCGGPVLSHVARFPSTPAEPDRAKPWSFTDHAPNSPIWMIKSYDKEIMDNHSGIDRAPFKFFIRKLYHDISIRQFDAQAFQDLQDVAEGHYPDRGCDEQSPATAAAASGQAP